MLVCRTFQSQTVPLLEVGVVLRVVPVAGLLQGVVEVKAIFLIDIHRREVGASAEPPLLGAWRGRGGERGRGTREVIHP